MNKKTTTTFLFIAALFLPALVFAGALPSSNLNITTAITNILNFIWVLFMGFAVLMFVWAGFLYLSAAGDPSKVSMAHKAVVWGIVGLIVAFLSVGIIYTVQSVLGV